MVPHGPQGTGGSMMQIIGVFVRKESEIARLSFCVDHIQRAAISKRDPLTSTLARRFAFVQDFKSKGKFCS